MEDQLLFFSPHANTPLPQFARYLKHKAARFQAICWCDEVFEIAGFEGKAELSRPILPLRLPISERKPVICLIPRNSFVEVFRGYTGFSPSTVVIGLEVKGQIKHLISDFDRYCRITPQDLSSLLKTVIHEKVEELTNEWSLQKGPKVTLGQIDKMENKVIALMDRVERLKAQIETTRIDSLLKRVKERLYRLKMAYADSYFAEVYLKPLEGDQLLVINWLNSPIECTIQEYMRPCGEPMMEDIYPLLGQKLMPGISKLDLRIPDYEITQVKVTNNRKVLSNTARFRQSIHSTLPNLNLGMENSGNEGNRPNSASLFQPPRLH